MSRILSLAVVLSFLGIPGLERVAAQEKQEPTYRGWTAKQYVQDLITEPKDSIWRNRAFDALEAMYPDEVEPAVPLLLEALKHKEAHVRGDAAEVLLRQGLNGLKADVAVPGLIEALKHKDPGTRSGAAQALCAYGARAEGVVPALVQRLNDTHASVRGEAVETLTTILELLNDPDEKLLRAQDPKTLAHIRSEANAAVPALRGALKENDGRVRVQAALCLWLIQNDKGSIPFLVEALKDRDLRSRAAYALVVIGPRAKAAVPALMEALKFKDVDRRIVIEALGAIGRDASAAVPALLEALKGDEDGLAAATALWRIEKHRAAIPALTEALKDHSNREEAARVLGQIGPEAKAAVPALLEALKDEGGFRGRAGIALWRIQKHEAVIPAFVKALKNKKGDVRIDAAAALGEIGVEAKAAVPALVERLKDADEAVRRAVARALKKIDPDTAKKAGLR